MKIEISKLSKSYGWSKALEGVPLEIESGQIVAILGPNGAGKTALLRCLAGLRLNEGMCQSSPVAV